MHVLGPAPCPMGGQRGTGGALQSCEDGGIERVSAGRESVGAEEWEPQPPCLKRTFSPLKLQLVAFEFLFCAL